MTDDRALTPDRTAEYERVLLGCALTAPAVARDLLALVQAPMIADPRLSRAWSALRRVLTDETGPVDLPGAVAAELAGDADEAPSLVDLHSLTAEVLSAANAAWYARRVLDAYVRRTAAGMIGEAEAERNRDNPTAALLAGVEERARHLRGLLAGPGAAAPVLSSAAEYADAPQPAPVLWRDDPAAPDSTTLTRCCRWASAPSWRVPADSGNRRWCSRLRAPPWPLPTSTVPAWPRADSRWPPARWWW